MKVSRQQGHEGDNKCLNSELWHACAGPLVSLPTAGSRVVYFPQGHSEQVAASTNKEVSAHIPNYPGLPPQLICQLHNITMHADIETDEVYAQVTLQPLTQEEQKDTFVSMEFGMPSKQPTIYFCKILTASDTSTHGGFSVPRRAAEKVFPPLDFSQQPPCQELIARDLHDVEWKFRHVFRGQPKRHLLTTGWSVFVSAKRLVAGDSILFIRNEMNQFLLGIRRAIRPQTMMASSVLTGDSMHIGLLAAAAHSAATNSCFTVFYNPRSSPSEFVIPLSKYIKAVFHTRISIGMRFRMLFETEESSLRRYMGTITGISDLDTIRWPNSHWRSVKVGWDESTAGEKQPRVSLWEIEPLTTFPMYPSLFPLRLKRPWHSGLSSLHDTRGEVASGLTWLRGRAAEQHMNTGDLLSFDMFPEMQQRLNLAVLGNDHNQQYQAAGFQNIGSGDPSRQQFVQLQQQQQLQQYLEQAGTQNSELLLQPHQQQATSRPFPQNQLQLQVQMKTLDEKLPQHHMRHQLHNQSEEHTGQQDATYGSNLNTPNGQFQEWQQTVMPSSSFVKTYTNDASTKYTVSSSPIETMLGSVCPEGNGNFMKFSGTGQTMPAEQLPHHSWAFKPTRSQFNCFSDSLPIPSPYPAGETVGEPENANSNSRNPTPFSAQLESTGLLPSTVSNFPSSVGFDVSSMPITEPGFQNSLQSCLQVSSQLLQSPVHVDSSSVPSRTFVKVYKSGSVGRSLDISSISNYHELREELAQMFGIKGKLEDPLRSGWQLVFVDREDDVLLLGDDPWESFVNNVWYIKILSPEDVQKMGEQIAGSFGQNSCQ